MEAKDLALAVLPAVLAIAIEAFNPFNSTYFERAARELVRNEITDPTDPALPLEARQAATAAERIIAGAAEGAASLVGVTPTFVSFMAAGISVVEFLKSPEWWLISLFVGLALVALVSWRILSARDILGVATRPVDIPLIGPQPGSRLCSWSIYLLNTVLIGLATVVFLISPAEKLAAKPSASAPASGTETAPRSVSPSQPPTAAVAKHR
jgi:hypothetical protein